MIIWDIHTAQSFQNNRNKYALSAFNRDIFFKYTPYNYTYVRNYLSIFTIVQSTYTSFRLNLSIS